MVYIPNYYNGTTIPCIYLTENKRTANLFIFFHGNSEDLGTCFSFGHFLHDKFNVDVAMVEYPGYGIYTGEPSEASIFGDAESAINFFTSGCATKTYYRQNIIIVGRSLGSAVGIDLASKYPDLGGVILISPFTSIEDVAESKAGSILAKLMPNVFENKQKARYLSAPALIIHGEKDTVVPYTQSQTLYKLLPTPLKMLKIVPGMAHNCLDDEKDIYANIYDFAIRYWPHIIKQQPQSQGRDQRGNPAELAYYRGQPPPQSAKAPLQPIHNHMSPQLGHAGYLPKGSEYGVASQAYTKMSQQYPAPVYQAQPVPPAPTAQPPPVAPQYMQYPPQPLPQAMPPPGPPAPPALKASSVYPLAPSNSQDYQLYQKADQQRYYTPIHGGTQYGQSNPAKFMFY
jgi:pimeloyl-ACP methyl ester carboxylesterase